jgi:hypothetical protein
VPVGVVYQVIYLHLLVVKIKEKNKYKK